MIRLDDQPPLADRRRPRLVAEAPNRPALVRRSRRGETERERRSFELSIVLGLENAQPLSLLRCGDIGCILAVRDPDHHLSGSEVERGLLEMGFVEGACIEVLHQGFPSRDPLAVRINQSMTVALRRSEASAVLVGPLLAQPASPTPMSGSGSTQS
ncbi:MAG: FeoA family protein [Candidatus Competibacteraceae bacterium]